MTPEEQARLREGVESLLAKVRAGASLGPADSTDADYDLDADIRSAESAAWALMKKMGLPIRYGEAQGWQFARGCASLGSASWSTCGGWGGPVRALPASSTCRAPTSPPGRPARSPTPPPATRRRPCW